MLTLLVAALIGASGSGLHGKVVIDPGRPVCVVGEPCSVPDANDRLAFWRRGHRVATVTTRSDGSYRVTLVPGKYSVTTPGRTGPIGRGLEPSTAVVPRGRYARLNFTLDVGIR